MIKGLKRTLEQDGYETDSASDGEEALKKLNSEHYDLILLVRNAAQAQRHRGLSANSREQATCPHNHAHRQGRGYG
ncbi:MAG: hypothetical protein V8Q85_01705 [Christensenellales bacterium]